MKITATVLVTSLTAWLDRYGWLAFGLAGGMLAKYALRVKRHRPIHLSLVLADIALLPVVALIAFSLAERIGAAAEAAALVASLCTVAADRIIQLYTERLLGRIAAMAAELAPADQTGGKE